jgi:hypothetical protein
MVVEGVHTAEEIHLHRLPSPVYEQKKKKGTSPTTTTPPQEKKTTTSAQP